MSKCSKYSDEELLKILKNYSYEVGFPTQRKFITSNGLPSYTTYFNRFGSFKNAIICSGITIPESRQKYFDRNKLTDEEMLFLLKYYTDKKLKNNMFLLTEEDISKNHNMPHIETYRQRFGSLKFAYKKIGIESDEYNRKVLEDDMLKKLVDLSKLLGHTPDSREINLYSQKGICYGITTYTDHFKTLYNSQILAKLTPTRIGDNISSQEALESLKKLNSILQRVPTVFDLKDYDFVPSQSYFDKNFEGFVDALKLANLDISKHRIGYTSKGIKYLSSYEHKFCNMLDHYKIYYNKEPSYKDYLKDFNKSYRFDYIININNKNYFIELFCIKGDNNYNTKVEEKINLCKANKLPLIYFTADELWNTNNKKLYNNLLEKINNIDLKKVI